MSRLAHLLLLPIESVTARLAELSRLLPLVCGQYVDLGGMERPGTWPWGHGSAFRREGLSRRQNQRVGSGVQWLGEGRSGWPSRCPVSPPDCLPHWAAEWAPALGDREMGRHGLCPLSLAVWPPPALALIWCFSGGFCGQMLWERHQVWRPGPVMLPGAEAFLCLRRAGPSSAALASRELGPAHTLVELEFLWLFGERALGWCFFFFVPSLMLNCTDPSRGPGLCAGDSIVNRPAPGLGGREARILSPSSHPRIPQGQRVPGIQLGFEVGASQCLIRLYLQPSESGQEKRGLGPGLTS